MSNLNVSVTSDVHAAPPSEAYELRMQTLSEAYEDQMMTLIKLGDDAPLPLSYATAITVTMPVSQHLQEGTKQDAQRLFQACHLVSTGKYEAACNALLEFVRMSCYQYGVDRAETMGGGD